VIEKPKTKIKSNEKERFERYAYKEDRNKWIDSYLFIITATKRIYLNNMENNINVLSFL